MRDAAIVACALAAGRSEAFAVQLLAQIRLGNL
ncbi:MAG: hypothetical protein LBU32_21065 [Clostridiales bacterium]|nr:hypothetical protein [Clostridiales bacterium]